MRMSSTNSVHGATVAIADQSGSVAWIAFGDENGQPCTVFMPYAKAVAMAEVFNAKDETK